MNDMTIRDFYRFIVTIALPVSILATAVGCSFKKESGTFSNDGNTTVEAEGRKQLSAKDFVKLFEHASEEDVKKELDKISEDVLNKTSVEGGSLLDTSILSGKMGVFKYLVVRGLSPFKLSSSSYAFLEQRSELNEMVIQVQNDRFMDFIRFYTKSPHEFGRQISSSGISNSGCQRFADYLLNQRVFDGGKKFGSYTPVLSQPQIEDLFEYTFNYTLCSSSVGHVSSEKAKDWLENEIVFQFKNNFKNLRFFEILKRLTGPFNIAITLLNPNNRLSSLSLVDPLAFLSLKQSCLSRDEFDSWWKAILPLQYPLSKGIYNMRMLDSDEYTDDCVGHFCDAGTRNRVTVGLLFEALFNSNEFGVSEFVLGPGPTAYKKEESEPLTQQKLQLHKLHSLLCGTEMPSDLVVSDE